MRIYNKYLVFLIVASGVINISLAFVGQNDLAMYFIINTAAYLAITLLYAYLNPRARRALNIIGIVLFAGFLVIVSLKALRLVTGR